MEVARDPKADWPFQLQEDTPAPSPFELVESPKRSPLDIRWGDVPSLLKTGWEHLTGQRPLLKTGQSDVQTLKEVYDKTTLENVWHYMTQQPPVGSLYDIRPALGMKNEPPPQPESLQNIQHGPAEQKDLQDTARLGLEIFAGLLTAGLLPAASIPSAMALMQSGTFIGILRNFGAEALRKALIAAAPAAVDVVTGAPEKALETFGYGLAGEYIGGGTGRTVSKVGQGLDRARQSVFGETTEGTMHRGVIEGLSETAPLGTSGKYIPKAVDTAMLESTLGGRVRGKYDAVGTVLDDELKRIQAVHPGGAVTAERNRMAESVGGLADETRLREVPREVRYQLDTLPPKINAEMRAGYQTLDADYFSRPVAWSQVKSNLPDTQGIKDALLQANLGPHQGQGSLLADTVRLVDNMTLLGDNVALDTAMDMQRTVDGFLKEARAHVQSLPPGDPRRTALTEVIQFQVEPVLGQVQQHIHGLIRPYAVSLQAAKRNAEGIVARAGVPDAVLEGQLAAGTGATMDPDVLLAYKLLKQPDFVNFSEAHGLRHEWLAASRLPGLPLIGDTTATRSKGMADMIDGSMKAMTNQMQPEMTTAWRTMDGQYKQVAQLYNSRYIQEMSEKNLDDILTQTIRLDRPNDIQALRQALGQTRGGGDMLDEVAQMWLSKRLEMVTPQSTKKANIDELLLTLDSMPPQTAEALFPGYPIDRIRDTLRQGKDMVDAVDIASQGVKADPVALQEVIDRLTPRRRERVLSDILHPMFTKGGQFDPIDPTHFLTKLQDLQTAGVHNILFTPEHYENLYHLAHTARAVKDMAAGGQMRYSPAVRWLEGGGAIAAPLALVFGAHPGRTLGTVAAYALTAKALSFLATNPRAVKFLTQGMTTAFSAQKAGEITGFLVGLLKANGLESEMTEIPAEGAPAAVPEQESRAAPGGPARSTD